MNSVKPLTILPAPKTTTRRRRKKVGERTAAAAVVMTRVVVVMVVPVAVDRAVLTTAPALLAATAR